jgi:hypothetical protein
MLGDPSTQHSHLLGGSAGALLPPSSCAAGIPILTNGTYKHDNGLYIRFFGVHKLCLWAGTRTASLPINYRYEVITRRGTIYCAPTNVYELAVSPIPSLNEDIPHDAAQSRIATSRSTRSTETLLPEPAYSTIDIRYPPDWDHSCGIRLASGVLSLLLR